MRSKVEQITHLMRMQIEHRLNEMKAAFETNMSEMSNGNRRFSDFVASYGINALIAEEKQVAYFQLLREVNEMTTVPEILKAVESRIETFGKRSIEDVACENGTLIQMGVTEARKVARARLAERDLHFLLGELNSIILQFHKNEAEIAQVK